MSNVGRGKWKVIGSGLVACCLMLYLILFLNPSGNSETNNLRLTYSAKPDKFTKSIDKFVASHLRQIINAKPAAEDSTAVYASQRLYSISLPRVAPLDMYKPGRAIVLTTTSDELPQVLALLQWIKRLDDDTPIEIFLPDWSHFEPSFCGDVFPSMDVHCRVLSDTYGQALLLQTPPASHKYLAMLASAYENVAYFDSSALPMLAPYTVFDSDSFNNTGIVLLPTGESSLFTAGQVDIKGCLNDFIYLAKSQQFPTLLLAAYYSIWNLSYSPPSAAATVLSKDMAFAERVEYEQNTAFKMDEKVIAWVHPASLPLNATEGRAFGADDKVKSLLEINFDAEGLLCDINRYLNSPGLVQL